MIASLVIAIPIQLYLILTILGPNFGNYEGFYNFCFEVVWILTLHFMGVYYKKYQSLCVWINRWKPDLAKQFFQERWARNARRVLVFETLFPWLVISVFIPYFVFTYGSSFGQEIFFTTGRGGDLYSLDALGILSLHWIFGTFIHAVMLVLTATWSAFIVFFLVFAENLSRFLPNLGKDRSNFEYLYFKQFIALRHGVFVRQLSFFGICTIFAIFDIYFFNTIVYGILIEALAIFAMIVPAYEVLVNRGLDGFKNRRALAMNLILMGIGIRDGSSFIYYKMYRTGTYSEEDYFGIHRAVSNKPNITYPRKSRRLPFTLDGESYFEYTIPLRKNSTLFALVITKETVRKREMQQLIQILDQELKFLTNIPPKELASQDSPRTFHSFQSRLNKDLLLCLGESIILPSQQVPSEKKTDLKNQLQEDFIDSMLEEGKFSKKYIDFTQEE